MYLPRPSIKHHKVGPGAQVKTKVVSCEPGTSEVNQEAGKQKESFEITKGQEKSVCVSALPLGSSAASAGGSALGFATPPCPAFPSHGSGCTTRASPCTRALPSTPPRRQHVQVCAPFPSETLIINRVRPKFRKSKGRCLAFFILPSRVRNIK